MLSTKEYKRKQFVYSEGDRAEEMYIIRSGEIRIFKNLKGKNITIGTLSKNSFFGEVALLRNERHSATAVAEEDSELAVITKEMLEQHLSQLPPWMQTIIRSLAHRLNDAFQRIETPPKEELLKKLGKADQPPAVEAQPAESAEGPKEEAPRPPEEDTGKNDNDRPPDSAQSDEPEKTEGEN